MSIGNTFYKRLSGLTLPRATKLRADDVMMSHDYSYFDMGGTIVSSDEDRTVIVPDVPIKINGKLFVEINPALYNFPCNYPHIVEPDIDLGLIVFGEIDELPSWVFRCYVAR